MATETNRDVFVIGTDHAVCKRCVSSLHREDPCIECGGDGWVMGFEEDG